MPPSRRRIRVAAHGSRRALPTQREYVGLDVQQAPDFSALAQAPRDELQPEEAIELQIMAKQPGSGMQMQQVALNLDLQSAFQQRRA